MAEHDIGQAELLTDGTLMTDLDDIVAKLIELGRRQGHLTFDALSEALPATDLTSREIETVLFRLNAANIDIVDGPSSSGPVDVRERAIQRLEQAIAALRNGCTPHAITLLKTALGELDGS